MNKDTSIIDFKIGEDIQGIRLDIFLAEQLKENYSRSKIKKHIKEGKVFVNGKTVNPNYLLKKDDDVIFYAIYEKHDNTIEGENIALDILYEDDFLLAINKQAGLVVHPGVGNKNHTLVNALTYYLGNNLSSIGGNERAGIIHRLDKNTSGVILVAKNDEIHNKLTMQFKNRTVKKEYLALVKGVMQHDEKKCEEPIGRGNIFSKRMKIDPNGKYASSSFYVLKRFSNFTFLKVKINTGRTHQIRVHLSYLGYPILGDDLYGGHSELINRQCLHAYLLTFKHPILKKDITIEASLPVDMQSLIDKLV